MSHQPNLTQSEFHMNATVVLHDSHVQLYRNWYLCTYRTLPYRKQACDFCRYSGRCL